jgi:hypothetical protein
MAAARASRARAAVEGGSGRRWLGLDWSRARVSGSVGHESRENLAIFDGPISFNDPVGKNHRK